MDRPFNSKKEHRARFDLSVKHHFYFESPERPKIDNQIDASVSFLGIFYPIKFSSDRKTLLKSKIKIEKVLSRSGIIPDFLKKNSLIEVDGERRTVRYESSGKLDDTHFFLLQTLLQRLSGIDVFFEGRPNNIRLGHLQFGKDIYARSFKLAKNIRSFIGEKDEVEKNGNVEKVRVSLESNAFDFAEASIRNTNERWLRMRDSRQYFDNSTQPYRWRELVSEFGFRGGDKKGPKVLVSYYEKMTVTLLDGNFY